MSGLNTSGNVVGLISCESDSSIFCVLLYLFLILLTVVTIGGNLLVITSIMYFKQLHTPTNYLILSLAVADLLMGALIFPFNMVLSMTSCILSLTHTCKIRSSIDFMISMSSILNLLCISIDRYFAVCQPLQYKTKVTDTVAMAMIAATWLLSLFFGLLFYAVGTLFDVCDMTCFAILCVVSFLTFYLPTILLLCVYFKIYLVAKKQSRSMQRKTTSLPGLPVASNKETKATKTLALVMGLFLLCWLPLYITYPFQTVSLYVVRLIEPLNWLALVNSMFNPFIYGFFYSWFRAAFQMIVTGKIFKGNLAHAKLQ